MKKLFLDNKINFVFLVISFVCLVVVLGFENISLQNTKWLHKGEPAFHQTGWYFFSSDIWRFPIGSNPNFGYGISNSIVFSDSIPILALIFKLLKPILPENIQYFSIWYFLCFYFQLFFSFQILKKFTESISFSFIGSIFFFISSYFYI